jgi:copper chaperone
MQFHVENMTCGGCARGVTRAIRSVDPGAQVEADPPARTVVVTSGRPRAAFEAALAEAGFPTAPEAAAAR